MRSLWLLALSACALLCACGTPGAPQPPSLELPRPVRDLQAHRKGDRVTLAWTAPTTNMDRTPVKHLGVSRVCRAVEPATEVTSCVEVAGEVPPEKISSGRATFDDTLPPQLQRSHPRGSVTYAIQTFNQRVRTVGLGNAVQVPLAPTLPAPDKLQAQVTAKGVVISWVVPLDEMQVFEGTRDGMKHEFHLFRRNAKTPNAQPTEIPSGNAFASPSVAQPNLNVLDDSIEWEQQYVYWADVRTTVLGSAGEVMARVDGADSPSITVFAHDVFPPQAPTGLQAVFSGLEQRRFIDLSWITNTESDLAGYNVYRNDEGGAPVKINADLVKTPAYRDTDVQPAHRYFYSVTAVDLRGNESPRSAPASESVP
jgi:hypothetical protein